MIVYGSSEIYVHGTGNLLTADNEIERWPAALATPIGERVHETKGRVLHSGQALASRTLEQLLPGACDYR